MMMSRLGLSLALVLPGFGAEAEAPWSAYSADNRNHHIEAALAPGWVGGDRVRRFEMQGDDPIVLRPLEGTSQLTWQRER